MAAARTIAGGNHDDTHLERARLAGAWRVGNDAVVSGLARRLEEAVADAWSRGWEPGDVPQVVERRLDRQLRQLSVEVVVAQSRQYRWSAGADPAWLRQVDELDAVARDDGLWLDQWAVAHGLDADEVVGQALELLAVLWCLPTLPRLRVPPQDWGRRRITDHHHQADDKILARIRALLAKAESTTFEEEAAAFIAKAEELMTRHAIDAALLDAVDGDGVSSEASGRRIHIDDPYAGAKSILLAQVAAASRCETVWSPELGFATIFGFDNDLDAVELLYTSLLVQATSSMVVAGAQGSRHRTRSYRQSFLVSFATRIGERLRDAAREAVAAAQAEHGDRLLPVLASREEAVSAARERAFPDIRRRSLGARDSLGWAAGRTAAEVASLACGPEVEAGSGGSRTTPH